MVASGRAEGLVGGVDTEFVFARFANTIFITISQTHRIGSMVQATSAPTADEQSPNTTISILMGPKGVPLPTICAEHIMTLILGRQNATLLLALALPMATLSDRSAFQDITKILDVELVKWL
eukprot:c13463_g1_i3.p1 GENE.c13463_g1_i3~~c13463_g1_i3.p1  ORF type:complete len:136 (+),score=15.15 c13463_g1_i3:44-409(+)